MGSRSSWRSFRADHLRWVRMFRRRSRTRTFTCYPNGKLWTRTEPETGTTTFAYNGYGMLATKSDQKGQAAVYTYDPTYRRLTKIQKYPSGIGFAADACQEVKFTWDAGPSNFSAGAYRRLAAVQYSWTRCAVLNCNSYLEEYAYTSYGASAGTGKSSTGCQSCGPMLLKGTIETQCSDGLGTNSATEVLRQA